MKNKPFLITAQKNLVLWTVLVFLLLKAPLTMLPMNHEEFRELDGAVRVAHGEQVQKDFFWIYGPLTPYLHAPIFKFLPAKLFFLRVYSLFVWCMGAVFAALILHLYFQSFWPSFLGALIVSCQFAQYPIPTHNHVFSIVAVLGASYFLLRFFFEGYLKKFFWWSYAFILLAVFTRPAIYGYSIHAAWCLLLLLEKRKPISERLGWVVKSSGLTLLLMLVFIGLSWPWGVHTLFPKPAKVGFWQYWPPSLWVQVKDVVSASILGPFPKSLFPLFRASLSVSAFFFFCAWIILLVPHLKKNKNTHWIKIVSIGILFTLAGGLPDLLMFQTFSFYERSTFYLAPLLITLPLVFWDQNGSLKLTYLYRLAFLWVFLWGYLPSLGGYVRIATLPFNKHQIPALDYLVSQPEQDGILNALQTISKGCSSEDYFTTSFYFPAAPYLTTCAQSFARDLYMYRRSPSFDLVRGESPYAETSVNVGNLRKKVREAHPPKFILSQKDTSRPDEAVEPLYSYQDYACGIGDIRLYHRVGESSGS